MHRVERGPEPPQLEAVRHARTPRWVRYYLQGDGSKPSDSRWREFQPVLSTAFSDICAYCEAFCKGDVDHFRPKSRYPEQVYVWANWVLACPVCNNKKGGSWPSGGYVDPCARSSRAQPESYFSFATKTAEIIPKENLSVSRLKKARQTIEELGLNDYHHRKRRTQWLTAVSIIVGSDTVEDAERQNFIRFVTARERELSSITRHFLVESGYSVDGGGSGMGRAPGDR